MALLFAKRIFAIEDNLDNLLAVTNILAFYGADVFYSEKAKRVTRTLLAKMPIDLILLDLVLEKERSGYDVFLKIRNHPILCNIPVIVVSGLDPAIEIPRAQSIGLSGYIPKPLRLVRFPQQLANIFEGKNQWSA